MPKTEEKIYLVPEINVNVSEAWVNLIRYCQENMSYGDLYVEINNGQPGKKIKEIPSIRFDKQPLVKEGICYIIQSLDNMRIPQSWINLIRWCQDSFTSGRIGFRIVGGQATELLSVKAGTVDFSKPETIPFGIPLNFDRTLLDKS